jgi:2,4-dienoyl-CoA reductase-like NADH-dependent reductase (Old Yellow Enzyme family)/thioredoxin reductase
MVECPGSPNPFFPRLFSPGHIGALRLKNRLVMPPMGTQLASDTGAVTSRMIDHYVRRAEGGVGLIIVEFTCVDYPRGKGHYSQLALHDDKLIAGHGDLAEAVHRAGAKVSVQLHHAGGRTSERKIEGQRTVAPGLFPSLAPESQPQILEYEEVEILVERFARAIERARLAGYDSVELHGAHGYLIAQFMSSYINNRTDAFGGSLLGRMKFPLDVIARARQLVGEDFPITMRFSAQEFFPGGRSLEESQEVARIFERAGFAALHVSAGFDTDLEWMVDPISHPQGSKVHMAAAIKDVVSIPVIAVGVIREPRFAEEVLAQGKADFVAVGRGLLAEPDWPRKAAEGRVDDIRKCFCCNYCDGVRNSAGLTVRCVMNPEVGRPPGGGINLEKAEKFKKVMVVGAGPAGMEAARVASLRGHEVSLFERHAVLGGQLRLAALAPDKEKVNWLIEDLVRELEKSPTEVHLNSTVTSETIRELAPQVVVLATGAQPLVPDLPGARSPNVTDAWRVLSGTTPVVRGRAVVVGGSSTGCEVALHLVERGALEVVVVEMLQVLAPDMEPFALSALKKRIDSDPLIEVMLGWRVREISDRRVVIEDQAGASVTLDADQVVLAVGVKPEDALQEALSDSGIQPQNVFAIGDCSQPATIAAALIEGRTVGGWL